MVRESETSTNNSADANRIPFTGEAAARLLTRVVGVLGGPPVWTNDLEVSLRSLASGFKELSPIFPSASVWSQRLQHLLELKPPVQTHDTEPIPLHAIALLLAKQAAVTSRREVSAARAVGALVFYTLYRGSTLSQNFLESLKQFYLSPAEHWTACRKSFLVDGDQLLGLSDDLRDVVKEFSRAVRSLQGQGMYAPVDLDGQAGGVRGECSPSEQENDLGDQASEASAPKRLPTRFSCEPRFDLLQFQIIQEEREPSLSQYRLDNDPNCLCEEEHSDLWANLLPALRQDADAGRRLHAAARAMSVLAGLSLEVMACAPFEDVRLQTGTGLSRGSLHVDLKVGLVRRDFLTVAPRADRDKLRTHGRYLRTPIPPEVLSVLREARSALPGARTLGDLLVAAGLTPTICHAMVNMGRTQPRVFESLRIGRSLSGFLLRRGAHPSVISHTTGDITLVPRAHHYYLSMDQRRVYQAVNTLCAFVGLEPVPDRSEYRRLGSPNYRPLTTVRSCLLDLQQQVRRARNHITNRSSLEELIKFHNAYVCSVALQTLWALGARCQNLKTLSVQALFSHPDFVLISDRASDRYSQVRLCVITPVIQKSLLGLAEHLRTMAHRLRRKDELAAGDAMLRLVGGGDLEECAVPLLFRDKDGVLALRPPTRADLKKVARISGIPALNTPRHFLLTELVERGVDAVEIDAQLGHHLVAAPPFGVASGLTAEAFRHSLQPKLADVHACLGLQPLAGLSSMQSDRLKLPAVRLGDEVELPANGYLRQAVDVADLNPPDIVLAEQDCPWSWSTLAAHAELTRLRVAYLRTDLLARLPHGSALLCLVAFDGTYSSAKLRWVWQQLAIQGPRHLGELHVVEQIDADVSAQILLHRFTRDALAKMGKQFEWEAALTQLKEVLITLDSQWSHLAEAAALDRLLALAGHTLHLETAPMERFSLVHKTPFIPFEDLQRLLSGLGGSQGSQAQPALSRPQRGGEYVRLFSLLDHWADHDLQLGERRRREQGALADLNQLLCDQPGYDEELAIQWLRRELVDPPLRRLSLSTVRIYLRLVLKFFHWVRLAERVPIESGEWMEVRASLFPTKSAEQEEAGKKEGLHRLWAWQHLVSFLVARGIPVPRDAAFRPIKVAVNYRPHLHVYVSAQEVQAAIEVLPRQCPTPRDWVIKELQLRRHAPLRPMEVRYLKAQHLLPSREWLLVTTSGHDHLKNRFARGLVRVPPTMPADLAAHMARRRAALETGTPSAFVPTADDGYAAYEASLAVLRDVLRGVTGRTSLRLYDLRACTITDLIAEPAPILGALSNGGVLVSSGKSTTTLHARGAVAAQEARHSNVITTLRYYHLAGLLGAREQMNQALASLPISARYLAAAHGLSRDAIYAARYRGRPVESRGRGVQRLGSSDELQKHGLARARHHDAPLRYGDLAEQLHAGLLTLAGMPLLAAADRSAATPSRLDAVVSYVQGVEASSRLHGSLVLHGSPWSPLLKRLSDWAASHQGEISGLMLGTASLEFRSQNISVCAPQELVTAGEAWKALPHAGVVAQFHPSRAMSLADRAQLEPALASWSVHIASPVSRESVGRLSFTLCEPTTTQPASSSLHVAGKTTHIMTHLMHMVVYLKPKEVS